MEGDVQQVSVRIVREQVLTELLRLTNKSRFVGF